VFKRLRWIGMGAAVGLGAEAWARRRLRRAVERGRPSEVGALVARRARHWAGEMGDALREGREAMAEREAQLRAQVAPPEPPEPPPGSPRAPLHLVESPPPDDDGAGLRRWSRPPRR
jgi:hypothetical protein